MTATPTWEQLLLAGVVLVLLIAVAAVIFWVIRETVEARDALAAIIGIRPRMHDRTGDHERRARMPIRVRWTRLRLPFWMPGHHMVTVAVRVKDAPHVKDLEQSNDLAGRMLTVLGMTDAEPPVLVHYEWRWGFTRP